MSDFSDVMAETKELGTRREVIMSGAEHDWNKYNGGKEFPHLLRVGKLLWEFTPNGALFQFWIDRDVMPG